MTRFPDVWKSGSYTRKSFCGERRYRAIKNNNLMKEVPCIVRVNLTPAGFGH